MTNWPEFSDIESESGNHLTLINAFALLEVKGADSVKFLQGQCSADMESLGAGASLPGAICTVKGRVVTTFFATQKDDSVFLVMPRNLVAVTADYLKKYAAFYKVELNQWLHPCIVANTNEADLPEGLYHPCHVQLGDSSFHLGILNTEQSEKLIALLQSGDIANLQLTAENHWLDSLFQAGWVYLDTNLSDLYLPHQLNLDLMGALNFRKGCYTGQEIVARMEYRGKTKKRLKAIKLSGTLPGSEALPAEIKSPEGQPLGELLQLNSSADMGLALLPVDLPESGVLVGEGNDLQYREQE